MRETLVDLLGHALEHTHDQLGYTFLINGVDQTQAMSYHALAARADALATWMREHVTPGERVLLLYPPGLDFLVGFFGCLSVPCVAVPVYPPDPTRLDRTLPRLQAIAADAQASAVLTTSAVANMFSFVLDQAPQLAAMKWLHADLAPQPDADAPVRWRPPQEISPDTLAFLQYTSGSTQAPRGVMVSHGNLMANLALMHGAFDNGPDSNAVNWLPLYHDMGLIGAILQPLFGLHRGTFMSPLTFLARPETWLQAISKHGGTHCGGPNFGYHLCLRRIKDDALQGVDLSCWRLAFNGAEPVRDDTMRRFTERFAPWGFRPQAFFPCYGLAEATLFVSGGPIHQTPRRLHLDPTDAEQHRATLVAPTHDAPPTPDARPHLTVVSSGLLHDAMNLRIVAPFDGSLDATPRDDAMDRDPIDVSAHHDGRPCPAGHIGEIWLQGDSVAGGYWRRPEASAQSFGARLEGAPGTWLRTGDLGFVDDGELFVMGRLKDLIIVRGRNLYPQDLERSAERAHAMLRSGSAAAFVLNTDDGEAVGLAIEARRGADAVADAIIDAIREAVFLDHDLRLVAVALLKPRTIPKTSSGKIQRLATAKAWRHDALETLATWQAQSASSVASADAADTTQGPLPTRDALSAMPPQERAAALCEGLCAEIARRLDVDASRLSPDTALNRQGLDSLAAADLQHHLETHLKIDVALTELLGGDSPATLAQRWARRLDHDEDHHRGLPLTALGDPLAPASHQQRRAWTFDRILERGAFRFHVSGAYEMKGPLDADLMRAAVLQLLDRHHALRVRFEPGDPLMQRVDPTGRGAGDPDLRLIDLRDLPQDQAQRRVRALATQQAEAHFKLDSGPLARLTIASLSDDAHVWLVTLHHIIADAASIAIFVEDLATLYDAQLRHVDADLPDLPAQFTDFARWQRDTLAPSLEDNLGHWREHLKGYPAALQLTTPPVEHNDSAHKLLSLNRAQTDALRALSQTHGVTLYMTLMAIYQTLLSHAAGVEDLLVDSVFSNRVRPETARMIGFIAENLVLRADLSGDPSFSALLERVRGDVLTVYERRAWRSLFALDDTLSQVALSPICLNMQPPLFEASVNRESLTLAPLPDMTRELMVHCLGAILYIFEQDGALHFDLIHHRALFDELWGAHFIAALDALIQAAVAAPDAPISTLLQALPPRPLAARETP